MGDFSYSSVLCRSDVQELINEELSDGRTPLHLAAEKGFTKAVTELIKRGANSFAADKTGKLPICGVTQSVQVGCEILSNITCAYIISIRSAN